MVAELVKKTLGSALSKSLCAADLFFDTETTGIPEKGADWETDYENFPRPLSISWKFNNKIHYYFIHQEGREVPPLATACNGITTLMANSDIAKPAKAVYDMFIKDAQRCGTVIGHNVYFDTCIVKADIVRIYGSGSKEVFQIIEGLHKDKRIDTMRTAWGLQTKDSKRIFPKWPKLSELYFYLFKEQFDAHDAMADTLAVERIYNEFRKRKYV